MALFWPQHGAGNNMMGAQIRRSSTVTSEMLQTTIKKTVQRNSARLVKCILFA